MSGCAQFSPDTANNEGDTTRQPAIWGDVTTACASDSKQFGAYDQNLMTEWHARYGGRGVMIYWHVETHSTCIYSQLRRCSSSEVAAMIEGVLRHCTDMDIQRQYVDSHGQSEIAFAFSYLFGFDLPPRLKAIARQKLYLAAAGDAEAYAELAPILTRAVDWELIRQQYDEMIKFATAMRVGTAEPEAILRRFTKANIKHPTYLALTELGKAIKTTFLCRYLHEESLRQEINEGLNVVENWNSANDFIFYGERGEMATNTNRVEDQELAVLALHLLQICLVYINTLFIVHSGRARGPRVEQPHDTRRLARTDAPDLRPRESVRPHRARYGEPAVACGMIPQRPSFRRAAAWRPRLRLPTSKNISQKSLLLFSPEIATMRTSYRRKPR